MKGTLHNFVVVVVVVVDDDDVVVVDVVIVVPLSSYWSIREPASSFEYPVRISPS